MVEIDFPLYLNKNQSRTFGFTNSDDSIYNLTGSTVKLLFYLTSTPLEISGTINIALGKVAFNFLSTDLVTEGRYEYIIEETKSDTSKVHLAKGNISLKLSIPFSESIDAYLNSELPGDITLTDDYKGQRITYWRRFLMNAFLVPESGINTDAAWTVMQNAFVAKLVAYDALMLAAKGSLMHIFGGSTTQTTTSSSSGGIKKIVTGPSEVEFFPTGEAIKSVFTPGANGSVIDILINDICGLANFLKVKVPMCKGNKITFSPNFYTNEDFLPTTTQTTVVSQGPIEDTVI